MDRCDKIANWLKKFIAPDQLTELRALNVDGEQTWAGWFKGYQLKEMAAAAISIESRARGVYFVPNPLMGVPYKQALGEVKRRSNTASDEMIAERRWLLIDVDPVRYGLDGNPMSKSDQKLPSTESEREHAWQVILSCREILDAAGLTGSIIGDSGNGWHVCYPVHLPNDDAAENLHREILVGLESRCGNGRAHVDMTTFNASRVWKLYGTQSRKGTEGDGRRFRFSGLPEAAHVNA